MEIGRRFLALLMMLLAFGAGGASFASTLGCPPKVASCCPLSGLMGQSGCPMTADGTCDAVRAAAGPRCCDAPTDPAVPSAPPIVAAPAALVAPAAEPFASRQTNAATCESAKVRSDHAVRSRGEHRFTIGLASLLSTFLI